MTVFYLDAIALTATPLQLVFLRVAVSLFAQEGLPLCYFIRILS